MKFFIFYLITAYHKISVYRIALKSISGEESSLIGLEYIRQ